jgi:hypothetical protein
MKFEIVLYADINWNGGGMAGKWGEAEVVYCYKCKEYHFAPAH